MRIGISIGHGGRWTRTGKLVKDNGAAHPEIGVTEFDTCKRIFNVLYSMLNEYEGVDPVVAPVEVPPQERVEFLNLDHKHRKKIHLSIELHLNGFDDRGVDGTECLYWPESDAGRKACEVLSDTISEEVGLPNRGAKARDDLYFLNATAMPAIIIEPFFITSDKSAAGALTGDLVQRAAIGIFNGILELVGGDGR